MLGRDLHLSDHRPRRNGEARQRLAARADDHQARIALALDPKEGDVLPGLRVVEVELIVARELEEEPVERGCVSQILEEMSARHRRLALQIEVVDEERELLGAGRTRTGDVAAARASDEEITGSTARLASGVRITPLEGPAPALQ